MLEKLKALNVDRLDVNDAIELVTFGRVALTTYADYSVPAPEWLKDGIAALDNEIKSKRRDMLVAAQRELQAKQKALKSREERKQDIDAELAKVNALLGNTPTA